MAYNDPNMKNFNNIFNNEKRNNAREGDFKRRDPGKRSFGDRDRERPQMYEAVCSDCGKRCEVPFRPTGDKPVYCSQCFTSHGGAERSERRERPRFQDKRMFDAICATCGKRFELPFRPTGEKPVYCNECFDKGGSPAVKSSDKGYKEQFDILNAKLDRIIKALTPVVPSEEKKEVIVEKKAKAKKSEKAVAKKVVKKKKAKK
jgi:CxxC-x17-CxxC domain-containing protein